MDTPLYTAILAVIGFLGVALAVLAWVDDRKPSTSWGGWTVTGETDLRLP